MKPVREVLLQCYLDGVARVRGRDAVRQYLRRHPVSESLHLVAIGKAAADMTLGALAVCDAWDPRWPGNYQARTSGNGGGGRSPLDLYRVRSPGAR